MKVTLLSLIGVVCVVFGAQAQDYEFATTWDKELSVTHGPEKFDKETLNAYSIIAYEAGKNEIRKLILDEVKMRTGEKANKKAISEGIQVSLPEFGEDVSIKAKSDDIKKTEDVRVTVAFLIREGETVNPTDHPDAHKAAEKVMADLAVILNQSVVTAQIIEATDDLEDLKKEKASLTKDKEKLAKSITDANDDILEYNKQNAKLQGKLSKAQSESASLEVLADSPTASAKDLQKYSKAKSKATDIEAKILKNNQKVTELESEIKQAEMEQPQADQALVDIDAKIESQEELVAKLQAKYDAIK